MAIKLVSLADLKTFMNIPSGESEWNALLDDQIIPQTSARIERFLNRKLLNSESDVSEFFDSDGLRKILPLRRYPIDEGETITILESPDRGFAAGDAIPTTDYVVWPDRGLIELADGRTFARGERILKATYQGGYTATSLVLQNLPDDLVLAAMMQMSHIWQRRTSWGTTTQSVAGGQVLTFQAALGLLPEVKSALKTHRRIPF